MRGDVAGFQGPGLTDGEPKVWIPCHCTMSQQQQQQRMTDRRVNSTLLPLAPTAPPR